VIKFEIPGPDRIRNCLKTIPFVLFQAGSQWYAKGVRDQGGPKHEILNNKDSRVQGFE
jgi:hypothetical protein